MSDNSGQGWKKFLPVACVLVLGAIILALYSNTLSAGFVYDDTSQIIDNPWITSPKFLWKIFTNHSFGFLKMSPGVISYRPLVFVVYMFEYALFALEPWGWHLVNIILHMLNTALVFFALRIFLSFDNEGERVATVGTEFPPFMGAMVFAVHPANSETVAWVGCVPELVYTLLCLSSLLLYVKARGVRGGGVRGVVYQGLAAFPFFLALFAKETAFAIPLIIFTYDCLKDWGFKKDSLKRYLPFVLFALSYVVIRMSVLAGITPAENAYSFLSGFQYLINAVVFFVKYLRELVIPLEYYPMQHLAPVFSLLEPVAFLSSAFVIAFFALMALFRKRIKPHYLLAFSFVLFPLLPALYIPGISRHPFNIRYLYLPSLGFALFFALLLKAALRAGAVRRGPLALRGALAVFFIMPMAYSYASHLRSPVWKDEYSLWTASLKGSPMNYDAVYMLGLVFRKRNMYGKAAEKFREAIRIVVASTPLDRKMLTQIRVTLAETYRLGGKLDEAVTEYVLLIKKHPDNPLMNYRLGYIYQQKGLFDMAISRYMVAARNYSKPTYLRNTYMNIASCYINKKMYEKAFYFYTLALENSPGDPDVLHNIEVLKRMQERGG